MAWIFGTIINIMVWSPESLKDQGEESWIFGVD